MPRFVLQVEYPSRSVLRARAPLHIRPAEICAVAIHDQARIHRSANRIVNTVVKKRWSITFCRAQNRHAALGKDVDTLVRLWFTQLRHHHEDPEHELHERKDKQCAVTLPTPEQPCDAGDW